MHIHNAFIDRNRSLMFTLFDTKFYICDPQNALSKILTENTKIHNNHK